MVLWDGIVPPFCEGDLVMKVYFLVKHLSSGRRLNVFT